MANREDVLERADEWIDELMVPERRTACEDKAAEIIITLAAEVRELRRDQARLDWLESEIEREADWYNTGRVPRPHSLFRRNQNITRACIDEAMEAENGSK